jgi:protein ImuB
MPTDRLRRKQGPVAPPADEPVVTFAHDGRRQVLGAVNSPARALGLAPGMPLAQAQAMIPALRLEPADPAADAAGLADIAAWCLRFAPLTAPDPPDGIRIDATGCAHLFGGEEALLHAILAPLQHAGIAARAAIADTPGAAWAVARHGAAPTAIVTDSQVLRPLPVAALRLEDETLAALSRVGLERIGQLMDAPRAPLALRFRQALHRLDQAVGKIFEPIEPAWPPDIISVRQAFIEPLLTAEAFSAIIGQLCTRICRDLEQSGQGARRLDLLFERIDGTNQAIRIGTARATRDANHLARLLDEQIETIDPGLGVEAMRLTISLAEIFHAAQPASLLDANGPEPDIATLVDRLVNRLGPDSVYRAAPVESDVPERSVRRIPPLAPPVRATWPTHLPRPSRMLTPPQPIEAIAMLPDQPPAVFTWRRVRHRIRRADGPERIHGEWWHRDSETHASRDYWQVEDDEGKRFWLYRSGDGVDPDTGNLRWFLHGFF